MTDELDGHFSALSRAIQSADVVAVLGAGIHFLARHSAAGWGRQAILTQEGERYLPGDKELYQYLAATFRDPHDSRDGNLSRLTQWIADVEGRPSLYEALRYVFDADVPVTDVHRFIARMPAIAEQIRGRACGQLVLTTNYDTVMERAFAEASRLCDVISYLADGPDRGEFMYSPANEEPRLIETGQEYSNLDLHNRSLVLKLRGTVDHSPFSPLNRDSYVITEDDYMAYGTGGHVETLLPPAILSRLYRSHCLFMGYRRPDLPLPLIFQRIWGGQTLAAKSWVIAGDADPADKARWEALNVDVIDAPLDAYIHRLQGLLGSATGQG